MTKLKIQPHGRLREWVAHEKGYFEREGLDDQRDVRGDEARD